MLIHYMATMQGPRRSLRSLCDVIRYVDIEAWCKRRHKGAHEYRSRLQGARRPSCLIYRPLRSSAPRRFASSFNDIFKRMSHCE